VSGGAAKKSAMAEAPYNRAFYDGFTDVSLAGARVIAPLVQGLVSPRAVADVGCGVGAWLSVFTELGVERVRGVDGDWVKPDMLRILPECFQAAKLAERIGLEGPFDLALSLEVAEHLPPERAPGFVAELAALAPVVLFSAAIPGQGGVGHVNEQWPDYWQGLFKAHDFELIDCIRPRVWGRDDVAWWYQQNCFLYARKDAMEANPALREARAANRPEMLRLVHPGQWETAQRQARQAIKDQRKQDVQQADLRTAWKYMRKALRNLFRR
jgi:SAM-dependent methyltransferase